MRKKLLLVPVVLALCIVSYGYSDATMRGNYGPASGMRGTGRHTMMKGMRSIGLDEKQMAQVKAIHFKTMKETIKKSADMDIAEIELKELFLKEPADFKAVEAKVREIEKLRGDIVVLRMRAREETRSVLTAEQKKKFDIMSAMMPMSRSMPRMGCGMTVPRGLCGGMGGWRAPGRGTCEGMDGMGMMDGGMMQSDDEGPVWENEMEQDEMPMEHEGLSR